MKKHIIILLFGLAGLIYAQVAIPPSLGDGSAENPYQIANLENLYWIAADTTNFHYHYIQTADIDAAETNTWFEGAGWKPIGNQSKAFIGSYNGQTFLIDSLYISNDDLAGLFGKTTEADLKNISISNGNLSGKFYIGGLAAICESSNIENCAYSGINTSPSGYHIGSFENGGLIGNCISSTITNSCTACEISGTPDYGGGLIGKCSSSFLNNCTSTASVIGGYGGGLIGYSQDNTIEECFGNSEVTGVYAGGLIGSNISGYILKSYSSGRVFNDWGYSGGLTGKNTGTIINCFSSTEVIGGWSGGLVASDEDHEGSIINSFSYGKVTGELPGGLISEGWNYGDSLAIVTNSFWDVETSEVDSSNGGTGLTTAQMKILSTYTDAGWDFVDETANGTEDIWNMDGVTNNGYPFLAWMNTTGIEEEDILQPVKFSLFQNYPNPFNPVTTIKFSIPTDQNVKLSVFNSTGQLVNELINKKLEKGSHSVQFNADKLNSGIYFYRLETEGKRLTNKMLLIR